MGPESKTLLKVGIYGGQIQPVIQWQQHMNDDDITEKIPENNHQVRKTGCAHVTGDGNEGHP